MLRRCPLPSRVLWTSSLDAWDHCFDVEDWQNVRSPHSYSGTKYAIDLYVTELNASTPPEDAGQTRHVLVHPGITRSSLVVPKMILGWFFDYMLVLVFYVVSNYREWRASRANGTSQRRTSHTGYCYMYHLVDLLRLQAQLHRKRKRRGVRHLRDPRPALVVTPSVGSS